MATNVAIDRMEIEDPAAASREVATDPMDVDDDLFSSEWYHCDFETLEILMSRVRMQTVSHHSLAARS